MKERGSKKKERQKQGAKSLLARMRPLIPEDPEEAHRIKAELEKIAEHGYETEIQFPGPLSCPDPTSPAVYSVG